MGIKNKEKWEPYKGILWRQKNENENQKQSQVKREERGQ